MTNEDKRQWVHLGVGAFALLLRYLVKWQAVGLAITAVIFNIVLLPRIAPHLFREQEKSKKTLTGIVAYPVTILILILACPWSIKEVAAGAWAVLAFGDSFRIDRSAMGEMEITLESAEVVCRIDCVYRHGTFWRRYGCFG